MSRADSGGFDLVLALSLPYLQQRLDGLIPDALDPGVSYDRDNVLGLTHVPPFRVHVHVGLSLHLRLAIGEVAVQTDADGTRVTVAMSGTAWFSWDDATVYEGVVLVPAGQWPKAEANPTVELSVEWSIAADGEHLQLQSPRSQLRLLTADGQPFALTQLPVISTVLAALDLLFGPLGRADLSTWVAGLPDELSAAVNAALPDSLPAVPVPFADVRVGSVGADLLALVSIVGPPGEAAAITRSPIRRAADGTPRDLAGLVVANRLILSAVAVALGKALGGSMVPPHPCQWQGDLAIGTTHTVNVHLTSVLARVDQLGALNLDLRFAGADWSGGFGLNGQATVTADVRLSPGALTFTLPTLRITQLDVWVAWWVYTLMAIGAGPLGALVVGLVDACAEGELAGDVNRLLTAILPKDFAVPLIDIGLRPVDVTRPQPDAQWQLANVTQPPAPPLVVPISQAVDRMVVLTNS